MSQNTKSNASAATIAQKTIKTVTVYSAQDGRCGYRLVKEYRSSGKWLRGMLSAFDSSGEQIFCQSIDSLSTAEAIYLLLTNQSYGNVVEPA